MGSIILHSLEMRQRSWSYMLCSVCDSHWIASNPTEIAIRKVCISFVYVWFYQITPYQLHMRPIAAISSWSMDDGNEFDKGKESTVIACGTLLEVLVFSPTGFRCRIYLFRNNRSVSIHPYTSLISKEPDSHSCICIINIDNCVLKQW